MKITVERFDWTQAGADLVVLIGDSYQDFIGPLPEAISARIDGFAEGFQSGNLSREVSFSAPWGDTDSKVIDTVYFHTSTEKGFTATENLKTFVARSLRLAQETGRKRVVVLLKGSHGEGMLDQLTEGALVGTYKFRDFLKDKEDKFADIELVFCPPTPVPAPSAIVEPQAEPESTEVEEVAEVVAQEVDDDAEDITEPLNVDDLGALLDGDAEESEEDPEDEDEESEKSEASKKEEASEEEASKEEDDSKEVEAVETQETMEVEPEPKPVAEPESPTFSEEELAAFAAADEGAVQVGKAFGEGVNYARNLIATPASVCTPDYLSKQAEKISKAHGFAFQSFGPKELKKHGFVGHTAVGGGSEHPPRMVEMGYDPGNSDVHLVLLGKGVTFDTGGISIKPASNMHLMIGDMSGAAAVLGAMEVIGRLKPAIKVTALIVSAENTPGAKAYRPGDILEYKNGVSVHIENTDAEGRLLLADGLIRAGEIGATHIVDIATLTGSCSRALGPSFTGMMGANRKMINAITRAGGNHGESYWRLPLPIEYGKMLKSLHADINNVGGAAAGATTAALFLKEFVPPRTPWVHLDIAGTFWKDKSWKYYSEGPSGTGVKTLADLALRWQEHFG